MGSTNQPAAETAPGTRRGTDRPLVEPPRLRTGEPGERKTTWMELFFDLVFVVAVDQVARRLSDAVTGGAVLEYLVLAVPVWWAWVGYVYYVDRFGTDDLSDRLTTLVQMGAALAFAVAAARGLERGSGAFALAYGVFRVVLALGYAVAAWKARAARPLAARFAAGYGLAALCWLASAFVPPPARFVLWGAGLVADVGTPLVFARFNTEFPPNAGHLQERFGNFFLIVLGEGAVGVVEGLRDVSWTAAAGGVAALALLLKFAIWWAYFETSDGAPVKAVQEDGRTGPYNAWLYAHLPLTAGVAAGAIAMQHAIEEATRPALSGPARWLLAGSLALAFAALGVLDRAYAAAGAERWSGPHAWWAFATSAAALAVGALAGSASALGVAGLLAAAGLLPVALDLARRARARRRATTAADGGNPEPAGVVAVGVPR